MTTEGVDYSTDRPSIEGLAAVGKVFACRYGGPGTSPKWLDVAEAAELARNGLAIVANAEGAQSGLLGGHDVGVSWATKAEAHFHKCGMPPSRPIYLSVDFDVQVGQWPAVRAALVGAASVLGPGRVGVYGGRRAIEWARRDNVARWFWQTYAWSGGVWVPGVHIQQYRNQVSLVGGTVDLDRALTVDFGQWAPIGYPQPIPEDDVGVWEEDVIPAPPDAADYATNKTWQAKNALGNVLAIVRAMNKELDTIRAGMVEIIPGAPTSNADVLAAIDALSVKVDELERAPVVDAVAVAAAIGTNPDVLGAISAGVAQRLATITGEISLSGALQAGIRPPVT